MFLRLQAQDRWEDAQAIQAIVAPRLDSAVTCGEVVIHSQAAAPNAAAADRRGGGELGVGDGGGDVARAAMLATAHHLQW